MKKIKSMLKGKTGRLVLIFVGLFMIYFFAASIKKEQVVRLLTAKIKANKQWYANVKGAAANAGISVENQIRLEITKLFKTSNDFIGQWWNF